MNNFDEILKELENLFSNEIKNLHCNDDIQLMFIVQKMWWKYKDIYLPKTPYLPYMPLKIFSEIVFKNCSIIKKKKSN